MFLDTIARVKMSKKNDFLPHFRIALQGSGWPRRIILPMFLDTIARVKMSKKNEFFCHTLG